MNLPGEATQDYESSNSEYWYDLFLAYEDLVINEGFSHSNIYVCYGSGQSFSTSVDRYKLSLHSWSNIVDSANDSTSIKNTFQAVGNLTTSSDHVVIRWVVGHGTHNLSGGGASYDNYGAYIENRDYYISEDRLIGYINLIGSYQQRLIFWMTCYSGCLSQGTQKLDSTTNSLVITSSPWNAPSYAIETDVVHSEYNWWLTGYLYGAAPDDGGAVSLDADDNDDVSISMTELFSNVYGGMYLSTPTCAGYTAKRVCTSISGIISITLSGTLSHDETWWGVLQPTLTGNVTVPSGKTLTIESGATVSVPSGNKITISGSLVAVGSGSYIHFDRSGASNWYGIDFTSTSSSNYIQYCEFEHMSNGLVFNNTTSLTLNTCVFNNNATALSLINSQVTAQNCEFELNSSYGVTCSNYAGFFALTHNLFSDNGTGICGDSYSQLSLGVSGGGSPGYNNFYNLMSDINSSYYGTVQAELNWWGDADNPSPMVTNNVDWQPYLDYDPLSATAAPRGHRPKTLAKLGGEWVEGGAAEDTSGIAEFDRALSWYVQGLDDQSLPAFQQLVARYPGSVAGRLALVAASRNLERLEQNDDSRAFLSAKTFAADTKLSGLAEYLLIGRLVKEGEYQEALEYSQKLVGRFPDSDLGKYALFEMAVIEWYYLMDQASGKSHFLEYIERYPNDGLAVSAMVTLGMPIPEKEVGKNSPGAELATAELPYEYSFAPTYPNPFNPTTTLSFSLAEKGRVHIALYNLRGECVRTIQDIEKEAGLHSITLDASSLPSGVYFARMNCNDFTSNRKLTLLK